MLKDQFPDQRILLCQFHAIKYVKGVVSKPEYCLKDMYSKNRMLDLFKILVYAKTEGKYNNALQYVQKHLLGTTEHPFYVYFEKNWHDCRDMWASYLRGDVPHLGNNTSNRIEKGWGDMKPNLTPKMPLDDTLKEVILCEELRYSQYDLKESDVGTKTIVGFDENMQELLGQVSVHAAEW